MWPTTSDAYTWTPADGMRHGGFECQGVVKPPTAIKAPREHVYDVIVVGVGYAVLVAARDLATTGHSVLLLEARDRIGGRSYSIKLEGFVYEVGGTWVSHHQPHTFAEMRRYGLDTDLVQTRQPDHGNDYFTINVEGVIPRQVSHEEADKIMKNVWHLYINIDGNHGKGIFPLPFQQLGNVRVDREDVEKWDKYTIWNRFVEIKDQLDQEEAGMLLSMLFLISGGNLHNSGMWDMIRSHALVSHDYANFNDIWFIYKLRDGQSALARAMFDEAVNTGLEYALNTPIVALEDKHDTVEVLTKDGQAFRGRRAISTIPLNVLKHINFKPPLSDLRKAVVEEGHICFLDKIHADVKEKGLASWNGFKYPGNLSNIYGDGITPNDKAHLVAFGSDKGRDFIPKEDPEKVAKAFEDVHEMTVERLAFHNWNTDIYSQGGPCFYGPGYMSKYQDELQSRHGNVLFASSDWANGWRAFIDGALEQGIEKAREVVVELRKERAHGSELPNIYG